MLDIDGEIACAMYNQRGHSDGLKHMPDIDGVIHAQEALCSTRAGP